MPRIARRFGSLIVGLLLLVAFPLPASAQFSAEDEQYAIDAVTSFLIEMGEKKSAEIWKDGWKRGIYTFKRLPGDVLAEADPGSDRIQFNENMLRQLDPRVPDGPVEDWAATFHHELVHTKQGRSGHVGSFWSNAAGSGEFHEASGWGRTLESYWGWLRLANSRYAKARTEDEKQKLAKQIGALSRSFQDCFNNYTAEDLGPLPKWLEFPPLRGTDSTRLTIEEALKEAARINKTVGDTLRLTVRLDRTTYTVEAGQEFSLTALPKNSWNRPLFTWKSGSTLLAEKGATLWREATVDETITVTVQDNRNQKASASCKVIVETPVVEAKAPSPTAPKTAAKTPAPVPAAKTPAPGQKDAKGTPIKLDLDAKPTQVTRAGSFIAKTWGGTTMDTFRIGGGELTSASFSRSRGLVIYNVSGTFKPGQTVSLGIKGSQWDMRKSMVGLKHNRARVSIRYLDRSGKPIGKAIEHDSLESKSPSLSGSVSGSVPAGAAKVIMEGQFVCTWASAYTTASETAGVKVTLTVEK